MRGESIWKGKFKTAEQLRAEFEVEELLLCTGERNSDFGFRISELPHQRLGLSSKAYRNQYNSLRLRLYGFFVNMVSAKNPTHRKLTNELTGVEICLEE